jgi:hypothetical protein
LVCLAGAGQNGTVQVDAAQSIPVALPEAFSFALYRYEVK